MNHQTHGARPNGVPSLVGTGLISLDVVLSGDEEDSFQMWAGGSCGNVLTIASYLGWRSYPLARLNGDRFSRLVLKDIKAWGVALDFIELAPTSTTPIITHFISQDGSGERSHRFSLHCHQCGNWLPTYKAVPASVIKRIAQSLPSHDVFYFDRVSAGALYLAKLSAELGALVVFEPSGKGDSRLFGQALKVAHVVKYSRERSGAFSQWIKGQRNGLIEIETLGKDGLRYRAQLPNTNTRRWKVLKAYTVRDVVDSAGAGDWCTAGLVTKLGCGGINGLLSVTSDQLTEALMYGQALGAWTCHFEGSRTGMYRTSRAEFSAQISRIQLGKDPKIRVSDDYATRNGRWPIEQRLAPCPVCTD